MAANYVEVNFELCKGCRMCIENCPKNCLVLGSEINAIGYQAVRFDSDSCTACGICFYSCPEADVLTVYKGADS